MLARYLFYNLSYDDDMTPHILVALSERFQNVIRASMARRGRCSMSTGLVRLRTTFGIFKTYHYLANPIKRSYPEIRIHRID